MEWQTILKARKFIGQYKPVKPNWNDELMLGIHVKFERTERVLLIECWSAVDGEDYDEMPENVRRLEFFESYGHNEDASVALMRYALSIHDEWIAKIQAIFDTLPKAEQLA